MVQHLQSEGPWEYHVMVLERLPESLALFSLDYDLHPLEVAYLPMKISMFDFCDLIFFLFLIVKNFFFCWF